MAKTTDEDHTQALNRSDRFDRAGVAKAQWQREMPELKDKLDPMVLLGRLSEAYQVMSSQYLLPSYKKAGLKHGDFDVLATLVRSGPPYELTPTALYRSTMMSSGGMTARLDKLEKAGHIERRSHPDDRRALFVCLTPSGLKLIKDMMPDYVEDQHRAVEGLSADERKTLSSLLERWIETADD